MSLSFYGVDEEFAAATGDNVRVTPTSSKFDYPPNSFTNLVITANPDDPDPRLFEIGDTYDLQWVGTGGARSIEDAVVVRSDMAPGGGGIIVFEGLDQNGVITQIIWTPDFDLQQWYWDNYNPSAEPQFYTSDQNESYNHQFICFAGQTLIEGPHGPIRCNDLSAGDLVDTLDRSVQTVRWVGRMTVPGYGPAAPVRFAQGSIGNTKPLLLSQNHRVLLRSARAELLFGSSEVLVPAKALVNGRQIRLAPRPGIEYVHLLLDDHGVLTANGALCESLFLGDTAFDILQRNAEADPDFRVVQGMKDSSTTHAQTARRVLTLRETEVLMGQPALHQQDRLSVVAV